MNDFPSRMVLFSLQLFSLHSTDSMAYNVQSNTNTMYVLSWGEVPNLAINPAYRLVSVSAWIV
jgi:hypothetical protein